MTLAQLIKDLIDTSKERIKTPISGAFLCSFVFWNWQPILLLLFSNQSIEDRIQIIDQHFYKPSAVIFPILISFFYLIIIPAIMIVLDWILEPIKKQRISRIYKSKDFVIDEKIKLARKEFELKNAESGNKQIEDFQRQIQDLEQSKNEIVKSNETTILQLNKQLKDSTETIKNFLKTDANRQLYNDFKKELHDKDWSELDFLINAIQSKRDIHKTILGLNQGLVKKLFDNEYIEVKNDKYILTQSGKDLLELM